MNYVEGILTILDCFTGITWRDRFGNKRVIWDNEFFFKTLHDIETEGGDECAGLLNHARYRYGLEYKNGIFDINETPKFERQCDIDERWLTLFASGRIYLAHHKMYEEDNSEEVLFEILEGYSEDVRNSITHVHNRLKESFPEFAPLWCASLFACLSTELLGYVYPTPNKEGYTYCIPIKTDDDKHFMMSIFNKMNSWIGLKPTNKWKNQSEKDFRHNVAKPFLREKYFEYRKDGFCSEKSVDKAIEDIKKEYPQWKDLWDFNKKSIMRHYIRKK